MPAKVVSGAVAGFSWLVVQVAPMSLEVTQEEREIPVVIESRVALGIGDEDGDDVVEVVGLDNETVVAEEQEFLVDFQGMEGNRFKVGHGVTPYVSARPL